MKAGRELDVLVAEKVMRLTVYHYDKDYPENNYYCLIDSDFNPVLLYEKHRGERKTEAEAWNDIPNYSTNISEAWKVVEKIADIGGKVAVEFEGYFVYSQIGIFEISPEAICFAALNALGVNGE